MKAYKLPLKSSIANSAVCVRIIELYKVKSKKKSFPKVGIIAGIVILALAGLIILNRLSPPNPTIDNTTIATDSASGADMINVTRSITQGTQMHLSEDTDVAVGGVNDDSAWLNFSKRDVGSTKKDVKVGDKFEIYGYSFEVLAMKKNSSLSLAPGSGNGYVKLLISKK